MPLMTLGTFVFETRSVPFGEIQQQIGWRHPANPRVGKRPARQFCGPDDEAVTLAGALYPELTGGEASLAQLMAMGNQGEAWPLLNGGGAVLGWFVIEGLNATRSYLLSNGAARKIEFQITLKRVDEAQLKGTDGRPISWQGIPGDSYKIPDATAGGSSEWKGVAGNSYKLY